MFRKTMIGSIAILLALAPRAFAQETEETPGGAPLFGAIVGGLIGGAVGAAVSGRAPRSADFIPGGGGTHAGGSKGGKSAGGGGAAHKGAPAGAAMRRKPGK